MCNFQRTNELPNWYLKIEQIKLNSIIFLEAENSYWIFLLPEQVSYLLDFSIERRWSSRRFSYGYLVTTSPQSLTLP